MRRLLPLFGLMLGLALPAAAQGGESYLLSQTNNLRASRGLPPYAMDGCLKRRRQKPGALDGGHQSRQS